MANPGAGAKFLSVNLNKSYGQSGHSSSSSSSYVSGRGRPGGYSAGGGGMVVLSRPRSSHKAAPKLSVPPPVNLPSLRKEHERFDPLGSGSGSVAGIGPGNGPRPVASAMGWSKASAVTQIGRDGIGNARPPSSEGWDHRKQFADGLTKNSVPPPAASLGRIGSNLSIPVQPEKTTVLRGEDFPSLSATISAATSGPSHKQKNGLHNQKQEMIEESSSAQRDVSRLSAEIDMRPRGHSSQSSATDGISANRGDSLFSGAARLSEQSRKQDSHLPVPLPLVRLSPRSDWADDERDTSHAFSDRGRDLGFSKMEPYWDKDFDFPRSSIVPHKPAQNNIDRWTRHDDNKGYGLGGRQQFHNSVESSNGRGAEWNMRERSRNGPELNRHKVESVLSSSVSNPSSTSGRKGLSGSDSSLNFGRGKQSFSRVEKSSVEDWGNTTFDESDPFSGTLLGIVKRKKDTSKQVDFHDPVRESFEAELERVQKLQEQERQRIIEEQERALEMARKEEEERLRMLREQEEHQRQMEEEAREAAWRAEQERLEAIRRAEEHKTVREEEKRRMSMEEERRKQAAKQKLLELEQRIARRQAEATKVDGSAAVLDERVSRVPIERDTYRVDEHSSWEDSERGVDRVRNSALLDSSNLPRSFDTGSRVHPLRDGPLDFTDRGKSNSWRRDVFENGNSSPLFPPEQVNGHQSPRRDAFAGGRGFPPRYSANGYMGSKNYNGGGFPESQLDDFPHGRNKDLDSEFHETGADRFNEMVLNQGNSRGNFHAPYGDRAYQNSELDELYSYGRPRYSSRQPRVLPPPMASMHRTSFRSDGQRTGTSTYGDNNPQYNSASRSELSVSMYDHDQQEMQDADILDVQEENGKVEVQSLNRSNVIGCDSQSSLSVSSPPHSPAHLSHDDLDDTGDSLVVSALAEINEFPPSGNDHIVLDAKTGKEKMMTASSCVSTGDDDEWAIESNVDLREQKDYDEDEDGYREEDEENERDNENADLALEFEGMHLAGKDSSVMENMVLGFDQGVEVGIPSDEYERSPRNDENSYLVQQVSADESFGDKQEDALSKQYGGAPHTVDNCSSGVVQEAQTTIHDMVTQPINDSCTPAFPDLSNSSNLSSSTTISGCQPVHSSANMNSFSSGPAIVSTAASVSSQNQAEMPVKLQFGLFSGPSLIPSPIPAIQIGSIQMPLQLPHQIGSSLSHMHPPQPTLFQFGQIRYPSPISHGLLQFTPQSMTCSQPNVQANHPLNQKPGVSSTGQPSQDGFAHSFMKDYTFPLIVESQHHDAPKSSASQHVFTEEVSLVKGSRNTENDVQLLHQESSSGMNQPRLESCGQSERKGFHYNVGTNIASTSSGQASEGQLQHGSSSTQFFSSGASLSRTTVHGQASGSRGRKVPFTARSHTQKLPFSAGDASHSHATGFQKRPRRGAQRLEFRVRQNSDRRQSYGSLTHQPITDMKSNNYGKGSGTFIRNGLQKETALDRTRHVAESGNFGSDQGINLQMKADKGNGKEASMNRLESSHQAEGRLKRHMSSEEDVDAPLQSGIVRIFNQPGIETPSDEDDFIEVRSKRQMLNDRREQREREKAKSKIKKAVRKPRSATQGTAVARTIVKPSTSSSRDALKSIHADIIQNRGLINQEVATGSNIVSQSLAPIGPPPLNPEAQAGSNTHSQIDKTAQTSTLQAVSSSGQPAGPGVDFDSEKKLLDNIQTSLGSWDNAQINQEVMPLTQTQFDDAMKPGRVDMHSSSVEEHIKSVSETGRSTSSIIMKDTQFASVTSPLKSLLAGEKIQFGAVTSPAVLPPSNRVVAHDIVPPGSEKIQFGAVTSPTVPPSSRSVPHGIGPPSEKIQFGALSSPTVLPPSSSSTVSHEKHMEDCEAEAEAAASAIAVAAISNDEGVRNGLGVDAKGFGSADMDGLAASGVAHDQPTCESKTEEALTVSLPADLSVETPPISLWPPLPSPHSSSSHILSPFPGGTPSPFPFYDMNPILGGPVFAFNPHDESSGGSVSQPQKTSTSDSGHLGTWQPCHSGVDSFYGPPAGFPGPFINPSGSIPGVQAPPHMVVYNHFAPVGRFGQVGLSYMGTYISSTKQPDWKHNPVPNSSGPDGEIKNLNMVSAQHNVPGVVPQPQHLAPGSALLPMASPSVAMFDVSPFQSSAELPVQACWPHHVPAPPSLQPAPHTIPLPQRADDVMPPQLRIMPTDNHSLRSNRFANPQTPPENAVEGVVSDATKPQSSQKFGLVDSQNSNAPQDNSISNPNAVLGSSRSDANKTSMQNTCSGLKVQPSEQNLSGQRQHNHRPGYNYQRGGGGGPHKSNSGSDWSGRRTGFHGRNQPGNGGRGFPPTKMKQIYVAKQSSGSGASTIQ